MSVKKILRGERKPKNRLYKAPALEGSPQKKGVCRKVYTVKPKKPNSATRKVAKVQLSTKRAIILAVPGQGHTLQEYSVVMVRGCRVRDLPGVHYKAMRGKYDFTMPETFKRKSRRSKFGIKKK